MTRGDKRRINMLVMQATLPVLVILGLVAVLGGWMIALAIGGALAVALTLILRRAYQSPG